MSLLHRVNILVLLLACHTVSFADTLASPADARRLADRVMAKVGAGEIESGLRLGKPFLIIPSSEFEAMIEQVKLQAPMMSQRFGKSIGSEFIREDKVGENLLRLTYAHRFEKHPMRWVFYFYRGTNGWVLDTFKTDDDIRLYFPQ
jgi:hypothetical protein